MDIFDIWDCYRPHMDFLTYGIVTGHIWKNFYIWDYYRPHMICLIYGTVTATCDLFDI